ncbi:MAG: alpha/beta hydrolase [Verrucomicrobiales bacterium]
MNSLLFPTALAGLVFAFSGHGQLRAQTIAERAPKQKELAEKLVPMKVEVHFDQFYAGNENPKQAVDLYLPTKRKSNRPLPVVVFIHGGGWTNGDRLGASAGVTQMARTGDYAGVSVGYRMSSEAIWPAQIHDVKAAIRWIRGNAKKFGLDPDRIGVWGSSAGGHLVSLLGTTGDVKALEGDLGSFTGMSSRVTCVVNICGPQDMTKPLMRAADGTPVADDPAVSPLLGGPVTQKLDLAKAASPLTYVTPDDAPFLTAHGTKDARVDFRNAEWIDAALKKAGVPSLLVPVENGGHGFHNAELDARIRAYFGMHLRGVSADIPATPVPDQTPRPSPQPK